MIRPDELKGDKPLKWSPGTGDEVWAMFQAAGAGDIETLEKLLAANPDLIRCQYRYVRPLFFARRGNHAETVKFLLARGMPSDEPDRVTNAPIHWAVMKRDIPLIDKLLAEGADINERRADGARPIHLTNGDYDYRGWRDVPKEVTTTPREVLDHLISRGAYVDIWVAALLGDVDRVQALLDEDPSLANRNCEYSSYYLGSGSALKNAAAQGHMEIVRLLLDRGADPNLPEEHIAPQGHALYSVVYNNHYEIAELLLQRGAIPNTEVESSADTLSMALRNGDERMINLLCSYGAARGVHLLVYSNDLRTAAAVFAVNSALADNPGALMSAAAEGHELMVRLMLRHHPDLPSRITQLWWGKGPTNDVIADLLFEHGLNPSHPDWLHVTPLHEFAKRGDVTNAERYIRRGADLNAVDEQLGLTPLGWAQKYGQEAMIALLQS